MLDKLPCRIQLLPFCNSIKFKVVGPQSGDLLTFPSPRCSSSSSHQSEVVGIRRVGAWQCP